MTGLTYEREALPMRTSSRREAAHGAASALEAKITKNAHGWRGESSLRLCGIALSCEPATEVRKCLARGTSPQNAPASEVAAATRRALHTPKLAFLAASLPKLRAWGLETLEADARLKRLTAPGVVQLEAAMVEVLAACSQRHIALSLLALPIVPCYPTRLISPAAQRRAMCLRPRWQWEV